MAASILMGGLDMQRHGAGPLAATVVVMGGGVASAAPAATAAAAGTLAAFHIFVCGADGKSNEHCQCRTDENCTPHYHPTPFLFSYRLRFHLRGLAHQRFFRVIIVPEQQPQEERNQDDRYDGEYTERTGCKPAEDQL